jgi:uncharacterized protein (TIGR00304 family)
MRRELGALLIVAGLMLVLLFVIQAAMHGGASHGNVPHENISHGNISYGGVLLIGPIPIVFGSSPQMALASMLLSMGLMVLSFLFFRRRN